MCNLSCKTDSASLKWKQYVNVSFSLYFHVRVCQYILWTKIRDVIVLRCKFCFARRKCWCKTCGSGITVCNHIAWNIQFYCFFVWMWRNKCELYIWSYQLSQRIHVQYENSVLKICRFYIWFYASRFSNSDWSTVEQNSRFHGSDVYICKFVAACLFEREHNVQRTGSEWIL